MLGQRQTLLALPWSGTPCRYYMNSGANPRQFNSTMHFARRGMSTIASSSSDATSEEEEEGEEADGFWSDGDQQFDNSNEQASGSKVDHNN